MGFGFFCNHTFTFLKLLRYLFGFHLLLRKKHLGFACPEECCTPPPHYIKVVLFRAMLGTANQVLKIGFLLDTRNSAPRYYQDASFCDSLTRTAPAESQSPPQPQFAHLKTLNLMQLNHNQGCQSAKLD